MLKSLIDVSQKNSSLAYKNVLKVCSFTSFCVFMILNHVLANFTQYQKKEDWRKEERQNIKHTELRGTQFVFIKYINSSTLKKQNWKWLSLRTWILSKWMS